MDINGNYVPANSAFYTSPIAGEQTKQLKASKGLLHYLNVSNTTAATIYVFLFDSLTATGNVVIPPIPVPANSATLFRVGIAVPFQNGLTVASSSTQTSYTAGGANDMQLFAVTK